MDVPFSDGRLVQAAGRAGIVSAEIRNENLYVTDIRNPAQPCRFWPDTIKKVRELTNLLNLYRDKYYNKNAPSVSDAEYDRLYDELASIERVPAERSKGNSIASVPSRPALFPRIRISFLSAISRAVS